MPTFTPAEWDILWEAVYRYIEVVYRDEEIEQFIAKLGRMRDDDRKVQRGD